jgi:mutator protein MutT
MLKDLIARVWQHTPKSVRRWSMRMTHTRFTVTAGAIVLDRNGQVLLLKHRFRGGSGWGIPGGFIEAHEQPEEAVKRELREEVGLEIDDAKVVATRAFSHVKQIEILFVCRAKGDAEPQSVEIQKASWFHPEDLPEGLPRDQKLLLKRILVDGANRRE